MGKKAITFTKPNATVTANTAFEDQLRLALKHLHNPAWLSEYSPLAAPYFLLALQRQPMTTDGSAQHARGLALQGALIETAQTLWAPTPPRDSAQAIATSQSVGSDAYHAFILDLNYIHTYAPPNLRNRYGHDIPQSVIYNEVLHISRASHDRHLQAAIHRLAEQVLARASPAWHAQPVAAPNVLIGREPELATGLAALQAGQSINLLGATGVGKTALGAALAQRWARGPVCWLTFRPDLNTNPESVLLMLAHFLQRQLGRSALWAQWVAQSSADGASARNGPQTTALALALLQDDLAAMTHRGQMPLLCFDDADVLAQPDADCERVRTLLDALHNLNATPMLVLGQRAVIGADVDCTLGNLSLANSAAVLQAVGLTVTPATASTAHAATGGNPRLLRLLGQANTSTTNLADALAQLPARPSLPVLMNRALARLPDDHQNILKTLSVFQQPAPLDAFGARQEIVKKLAAQGWLELCETHSVGLPSVLGLLVAKSLSPQQHAQLHGFAAQVFAQRGEMTLAAEHYVQAGQYESAILAWWPHAEREMGRGHAALALAVFSRVPAARLSKSFADQWVKLRARLHRALGQPTEIVALAGAAQPLHEESLADFLHQLGWAHEQLGHLEPALEAYARSQHVVERLSSKAVGLAASRARVALRQRNMPAAKQEAQRAAYEAERIQGVVHDEAGEPEAAQAHFLRALAHAEALNDSDGIALTCNSLGVVAGRQGDVAAAGAWLARAAARYADLGNALQAEIVRSNLTALLTTAGQHAEAVRVGVLALAFFQKMGHAQFIASTASSLAESSFVLGDFDEAQRYSHLVIAQEETQFVPYGLYTLGDVQQARGQLREARDLFKQSHEMAQRNKDRYMQAYAVRKLGQVCVALGETETGHAQISMARQLFTALGMAHEAADLML